MIDDQGNNLGSISNREALEKARSKNLDLVEVSPNSRPPVCKIMDFGKYLYELKKKQKEQRKTVVKNNTKTLKIGFKTEEHDMQMKIKKAEEFLLKKLKVKVMLLFRGREISHKELAIEKMNHFAEQLSTISEIGFAPKVHGRQLTMVLNPNKK